VTPEELRGWVAFEREHRLAHDREQQEQRDMMEVLIKVTARRI